GVVADPPGPLVAGAGHHVEVVEVVAGGGHGRAVPAVRDGHHVPGAHLGEDVDGAVGGSVDPLVAGAGSGGAGGDLEVVDLLQHALGGGGLVVLVRRVGGPVRLGGEHLAGDQPVRLERVGGAEVVHLPAGLPGAAQLHRDVLGGAVAERQPPLAAGRGQCEPAAVDAGHGRRGAARDVGEVGDPAEHVGAALQGVPLPRALHRAGAAQRQHQGL